MKPKQFADQFSQCEKTVFKDSQVQAEVGDPLWVTPKDFRDAWVQKDMDPRDSLGNGKPSRGGSSVAPPKQEPQENEKLVTSAKTLKLETNSEAQITAPQVEENREQTR